MTPLLKNTFDSILYGALAAFAAGLASIVLVLIFFGDPNLASGETKLSAILLSSAIEEILKALFLFALFHRIPRENILLPAAAFGLSFGISEAFLILANHIPLTSLASFPILVHIATSILIAYGSIFFFKRKMSLCVALVSAAFLLHAAYNIAVFV